MDFFSRSFKVRDKDTYSEKFIKVILYLPACLHIYHLYRSLFDKHYFDLKVDNALKFFKDEYYFESNKYCLTGAEKHYGSNIIDFISVIELFSSIYSVVLREMTSEYQPYLQQAEGYSQYVVFVLAAVQMLFGSPDAYFKIRYDI